MVIKESQYEVVNGNQIVNFERVGQIRVEYIPRKPSAKQYAVLDIEI